MTHLGGYNSSLIRRGRAKTRIAALDAELTRCGAEIDVRVNILSRLSVPAMQWLCGFLESVELAEPAPEDGDEDGDAEDAGDEDDGLPSLSELLAEDLDEGDGP